MGDFLDHILHSFLKNGHFQYFELHDMNNINIFNIFLANINH